MYYRRDIDGLRAVAVLPVVFFHAGVPGFSGGFTGVDVFFVISGYLITSLIAEEIRQERFSIVVFYERRIRRIFPALIAVLCVSSVLATWLLMPAQFDNFSKSVFATALFSSNIFFWTQTGYFAAPATEIPLLHTWSLAVEEQFYVVFPLVLFVIHRWLKGRWIAWLAPIALLSFVLSIWGVAHKPSATFYLAPTRAWELLLGSLLALNAVPRLPNRAALEVLSVAGLGLIGWGVIALSAESSFPGANALFPCLGAALVIYTGQDTLTATRRLLGTKPLVAVGLISYSLYLWHWPLLVFAPLWNIYELTWLGTAAVVGLSFVAAILSWKFVELPFRRRSVLPDRRWLFTAATAATFLIGTFGLYGYFARGWPHRIPASVAEIASYSNSTDPRQKDCLDGPNGPIPLGQTCDYGSDVPVAYAVWGDSHAGALIAGIGRTAKIHNAAVRFFGASGCPPMLDVFRVDKTPRCNERNRQIFEYLVSNQNIQTVIIICRYAVNLEGRTGDFGPAERGSTDRPYITDEGGTVSDLSGRLSLFERAMADTVGGLLAHGKRVVLVYPIPEVGYDVPPTLARMALEGNEPESFTRPFSYYQSRQSNIFSVLDSLGQSDQIIRIYPHKRLCDLQKCIVYADGKPLYKDDDHLSLAGADFVAPLFGPVFESVGSKNLAGSARH